MEPEDMTNTRANEEPTLLELRERFRTGEETPLDAARRALSRIDELDSELHAFLATDPEGSLAAAQAATDAWHAPGPHPPLLGIPISVKDTIEVAGMPTTYGSTLFRDNIRDDSVVAERLRAAGAVVIGKTNTPEFALITEVRNNLTPRGRNPLNTERTCGGSSGGAAASVAAGMSTVALGTDSAGSVRIPAAYQGLVGFKPSYQRIPWVQDWKASLTRSHIGPITRDVSDAWALTVALSGEDWRDPSSRQVALGSDDLNVARTRSLNGLRAAVLVETDPPADAQDAQLLEELLECARAEFASVEVLTWDSLVDLPSPAPGGWAYAGEHVAGALALLPELRERLDELTEYARPIYEWGLVQTSREYIEATSSERRRGSQLAHALKPYDCALSLVAPEAPPVDQEAASAAFPRLALVNIAGLPAVSVPFGAYQSGLPRAIQVVGRFGADAEVLAIAERLTVSE